MMILTLLTNKVFIFDFIVVIIILFMSYISFFNGNGD